MDSERQLIGIVAVCGSLGSTVAAQQRQPHANPGHMEHRFDDPERFAKSFDDPARDAWQLPTRVIDALEVPASASVADIGAGTGHFSVRLAKAVPRGTVYAVDIEPSMLEHVRRRAVEARLPNIVTVEASTTGPNLPKPIDLAIVVDTYHHIADRPTYFRDLQKALAADARVAVIDFRKDSPEGPPPEFRFEADQIVAEMNRAGLRLDAKHDFLPRQHFLIFRVDTP
jgi:ubiquinone/menaquinone biosynthesis C-methylase UbiE